MKIGRNDPCPCGSGKKNKKCCNTSRIITASKYAFENFNPIDVLTAFSLLQLVPENHGKNLRIEKALADYLLVLDSISYLEHKSFSSKIFLKEFNNIYFRLGEDPPENSYIENIMFKNGNNMVFAGISEEGTSIVQNLIDSMNVFHDQFPKEFILEVENGILFILEIHNLLCEKLSFHRYCFKDQIQDDLHLNEATLSSSNDLISFDEVELKKFGSEKGFNWEVVKEFVSDTLNFQFNPSDPNSNILLRQPFIHHQDKYLLVMPSAEINVLNEFIISKAQEHSCFSVLKECYSKYIYSESLRLLYSVGYSITDIGKPQEKVFEFPLLNVLQFDNDKFAILVSPDIPSTGEMKLNLKELKGVVAKIKSLSDHYKIHLLILSNQISSLLPTAIALPEIKGINHLTAFSVAQLQGLLTLWDIDHLSLWKFQKTFDLESESMTIAPFFNILSHYDRFESNKGSLLDSDQAYDYLMLDFYDQANLIRKINQNRDVHLTDYILNDSTIVKVPVQLKEPSLPVYVPIRKESNRILKLLELYEFPLWIECENKFQNIGEGMIDTITFWFHEMFASLNDHVLPLGKDPILITLDFDSRYINEDDNILSEQSNLLFSTDHSIRRINIHVPVRFSELVQNQGNSAERILIGCTLKGLFQFVFAASGMIVFDDYELGEFVNSILHDETRKMILPATEDSEVLVNNTGLVRYRYLQECDISLIRLNILGWAKIDNLQNVASKKDKTSLCNKLVTVLIHQYRENVSKFNALDLLKFAIIRHESTIYFSTYRDLSIGTRIKCFPNSTELISNYKEERIKSITSVLAYRCLIEFIVSEPPQGQKPINNDDVDFLHALVEQIINFGNLSEVIHEEFSDTPIDILPSGRIGIDHNFFNNELNALADSIVMSDINDSVQSDHFVSEKIAGYEDSITRDFEAEWGVCIFDVVAICNFLSRHAIYERKTSFVKILESDFFALFEDLPFTKAQIESFIKIMSLNSRGSISSPPEGYRNEDIFPWRYNRRLSYISLPLISLQLNGEKYFIWGPRHLEMAAENLLANFYNGSLKVPTEFKRINSQLAKRNAINGKKFRARVFNWLEQNTSLSLIPHEVKISTNGAFKTDRNYGDIDILAIDGNSKTLILFEIKNTKQAKVIYEFKRDIESYLSKLIPKHMERAKWIESNLESVSSHIKRDVTDYKVFSAIISSSTLPVKYMEKSPLPIYSFSELKANGIEILSL